MAIDSAEKRKSISGINFFNPGVTPNSGQDQEWRQEAGYGYSGILAAGAGGGDFIQSIAGYGGIAGPGGNSGRAGGIAG